MNDEQIRKIVNEALAAQQKLFTQQIQQSTMFNRNIKIEQLKAEFKNPADKRAIGYLADEEFDWKDFRNAMTAITVITVDDQLLPVQENVEKFAAFGEFCLKFAK